MNLMSLKSEWGTLLTHATLKERLEMVAIELENLESLAMTANGMTADERDILCDIEDQKYHRAIQKATGNYEPPDPPGWEGGFADNH